MTIASQIESTLGRAEAPMVLAPYRVLAPYNVEIAGTFASILEGWSELVEDDASLAFRSKTWLESWSSTFGLERDVDVVAATVYDACWSPVMALPLVRRREGTRLVITFADSGVADYNAPILSPSAPIDRAGAMQIWSALRRALPDADTIRLERMPLTVGSQTNPLSLLRGKRPAQELGLALAMPCTYADWRTALPRRYRMELSRCARLFDALPGASFFRVDGLKDSILAALENLQRERIRFLGLPYELDGVPFRDFYRKLIGGPFNDPVVLTALTTDQDIVAVLLGLRHGKRFVMLRIGAAGGVYARLSPARHLITRTMELLRAEGVEYFDFGRGDYTYKRKLGGEPVPLCDLVSALSPRGLPEVAAFRLRSKARTSPHLRRIAACLASTRCRAPMETHDAVPRFGQKASA